MISVLPRGRAQACARRSSLTTPWRDRIWVLAKTFIFFIGLYGVSGFLTSLFPVVCDERIGTTRKSAGWHWFSVFAVLYCIKN